MKSELGVLESNKELGEVRLAYRETYLDAVKRSDIVLMDDVLERFGLGGNWVGAVSGRIKLQTGAADRLRNNVG